MPLLTCIVCLYRRLSDPMSSSQPQTSTEIYCPTGYLPYSPTYSGYHSCTQNNRSHQDDVILAVYRNDKEGNTHRSRGGEGSSVRTMQGQQRLFCAILFFSLFPSSTFVSSWTENNMKQLTVHPPSIFDPVRVLLARDDVVRNRRACICSGVYLRSIAGQGMPVCYNKGFF